MSNSVNATLAWLAASYASNPLPEMAEPIVTVLPASAVKPKKEKKQKQSKRSADAAPATQKSAVLPNNLPVVGSLTATQFLLALRDAGKRSVEAKNEVTGEVYQRPIFDASLVREDTIRAIAGYVGYDAAGDYGTQDAMARTRAQSEIRGGVKPVAAHRRGGASVAPTITGFISGMPDHLAKQRADLLARERLAVDTLANHLANVDNPDFVQEPGMPSPEALAEIERERLRVIRDDLAALGE
jgi:hypothetical protein